MHTITFAPETSTLVLRLEGFWSLEAMERFEGDLNVAVADLCRRGLKFGILSDCRGYPIQSVEIGLAFARFLGAGTCTIAQPYAVIVGGVLNKMQAERVLTAPNVRVFTSLSAGKQWLSEQLRRQADCR